MENELNVKTTFNNACMVFSNVVIQISIIFIQVVASKLYFVKQKKYGSYGKWNGYEYFIKQKKSEK